MVQVSVSFDAVDLDGFVELVAMTLLLLYFPYHRHAGNHFAESSIAQSVFRICLPVVELVLVADADKKFGIGGAGLQTCQ